MSELDTIEKDLATAATVTDVVEHGFALIEQVIAAIRGAKDGTVKPDDALAHIGALHQALLGQRAATDKALHDKFHPPTAQ